MEFARVLVVEDDPALRSVVSRGLRRHGAIVTAVNDGAGALTQFTRTPDCFDAVILDVGLPDSDGRDVCQALRARGVQVPVLFLTARGQVADLMSGFAAGGDEYIAKPFDFDELLARLGGLLRRSARPVAERQPAVGADRLHLNPRTHSLELRDARVRLTPTEFRLLATLIAATGQVVRRRDLVNAAWPAGAIVHDNTLDQYIAKLRRKLASLGGPGLIATAHGVGYEFR